MMKMHTAVKSARITRPSLSWRMQGWMPSYCQSPQLSALS
jgi:hypothetical protein